MAYDREAIAARKLAAAGINKPEGITAYGFYRHHLTPTARKFATTQLARREPDYKGGGPAEVRPAARRVLSKKRPPFHQRKGSNDYYRTSSMAQVRKILTGAGQRRTLVTGRFWIRERRTGYEGWQTIRVGEPPVNPSDEVQALEGPDGKVLVTVGPSGNYQARQYLEPIRNHHGDVAAALRSIIDQGGFIGTAHR